MLIVDIRRPVSPEIFKKKLRQVADQEVFAFTPLSAWLLEQADVSFLSGDKIVSQEWYKEEGFRNFSRIRDVFEEVFDREAESWFGLYFELKILLDYALLEEQRWSVLESKSGKVLSDLPHASRQNLIWADHVDNKAALYLWGVPSERFFQVPRVSETAFHWMRRLSRINCGGIRRRIDTLYGLLPSGHGPALVTTFGYDWGAYRKKLGGFRPVSASRLAREALATAPLHEGYDRQVGRLYDALQVRLGGILSKTLPRVLEIMSERFGRYAKLRYAIARNISRIAKRHDVRASLSTESSGHEDFLVNFYLKKHGYPTCYYQHGGYNNESPIELYAEIVPATHNFVYGEADAAFFRKHRPGQPVFRVGSSALACVESDAGRPGRFLYILYPNEGNSRYVRGPYYRPLVDETALFRRHRQVIDLFARHPEKSLYLREHPAQVRDFLYEPLREYIRQRRYRNIFMDDSPGPTEKFLRGYEGIILDYISTTILYAMAMKKNTACFLGDPDGISPEAKRLLNLAAMCAQTNNDFVRILEEWITKAAPKTNEEARRSYLALHGGKEDDDELGAWPHLKRVLESGLSLNAYP